jgi:hypothetical protein
MESEEQGQNKVNVSEVQTFDTAPETTDPQLLQAIGHADSALVLLGLNILATVKTPVITNYDIKEDFEWFASGQLNVKDYKGKYIAVWRKQIVGSGATAVEAERIAQYNFPDCRPAIVYVPEDENAIL